MRLGKLKSCYAIFTANPQSNGFFHLKRKADLPSREISYYMYIHIWRPGDETTTNSPKFKCLSVSFRKELFTACLKHDLIVLRACLLLPAWDSEGTGSDSKESCWLSEWHTWHLVRPANTGLKYPRAPSNEKNEGCVASTPLCLQLSQSDACGVPNLLNPLFSPNGPGSHFTG